MKRLRLLVLLSFALLATAFLLPRSVGAQNVDDFYFESMTANYYLDRSEKKEAELSVIEELTAVFPDYDQNHGILRALPNTYKGNSLRLEVVSVTDKYGTPYEYATYEENDNTVLKIGDADQFVRGRQTYIITYTMRDVITFFDGYDEWYWNVNGTQWRQPFGSVVGRIHLPMDIANELSKSPRCYSGYQRSTESNCEITASKDKETTIINVRSANLQAGQNLTFLLGFKEGTFTPYQPTMLERIAPLLLVVPVVLPPIATVIWITHRWRKSGRDPKGRGVIVPQYVPPQGFTAVTSEGILQEKIRSTAMSAGIVELATSGYIYIHELPSEKKKAKPKYSLELVKPLVGLHEEQRKLVHAFFGEQAKKGQKVELEDLKNKLYKDLATIQSSTMEQLYKRGFFSNNPAKTITRFIGVGSVLAIIGFIISFTGILTPLGIGLIISGVIVLLSSKTMPARSVKGVEIREYLLGLKEYILLAEKDRIAFLQSPEGVRQFGDPKEQGSKVKLFETLLPYAMLFGIEKKWAEQFKDLYIQPPEWYRGNMTAFNASYLAGSLHDFSSATATSFSAPASSGSSGYSGGGGFSGGGGGGGGGGGW